MTYVFEVPAVGEGVVEVEIAQWMVAVGDSIAVDQPLCEITSDKASMDVPSPRAGVVKRLHGEVGDIVKVHTPLVEIELEGGEAASAPEADGTSAAPPPKPSSVPAPPRVHRPELSDTSDPRTRGRTKAAPAVRRRARELGIDIDIVPGSGKAGRVSHADLEAHQAPASALAPSAPRASAPLPKAPPALPQAKLAEEDQVVKIVGVRRAIAARMLQAKTSAPHFTYVDEVDCTQLVALRERLKVVAAARGVRLTYLPIWAKAASLALRSFPNANAWMDNDKGELTVKAHHHFGFACDTPSGLMVPVVRHIERKSILQIATELEHLFERARAGQASREELSGSTFTITGVGNIGGMISTPILNVPEVAILGINQIKPRAVVLDDGTIAARPTTYLSPSFDHRIVDGAVAARFVAHLRDIVTHPDTMLLELV